MSLFTNKTLMITGGTGSFGNAVLRLHSGVRHQCGKLTVNLVGK